MGSRVDCVSDPQNRRTNSFRCTSQRFKIGRDIMGMQVRGYITSNTKASEGEIEHASGVAAGLDVTTLLLNSSHS